MLTIHHVKRNDQSVAAATQREVHTLKMKIQEIMKGELELSISIFHTFSLFLFIGSFDYFMQKEIFEQPESVVNTMRGRVRFEEGKGQSVKPL